MNEVFAARGPGAGSLVEVGGGSAPLPKKILYLVGIRYAISLPILVKNCLVLIPNY